MLADVTTTNVIGVDPRLTDLDPRDLGRTLLVKNAALILLVGVPTMIAVFVLTLVHETPSRLASTLPDVALPIFAWLGVGNLVSVVLPVAIRPLRQRWMQRHDRRSTTLWLGHLALPYALYYVVAPVGGVQRELLGPQLSRTVGPAVRALCHIGVGVAIWIVGTLCAIEFVRRRGLRIY